MLIFILQCLSFLLFVTKQHSMPVIILSNIFNLIESLWNHWILKINMSLTSKIKKKPWSTIQYQGYDAFVKNLPWYTLAKFDLMDTAVLRYLSSLLISRKVIPIKARNCKTFRLVKIEIILEERTLPFVHGILLSSLRPYLLVSLLAMLLAGILNCLLACLLEKTCLLEKISFHANKLFSPQLLMNL